MPLLIHFAWGPHSVMVRNWLYAQLHYFLNFSQLLVSCLPLLED